MKKTITIEDWKKFCSNNCLDTYSMAISYSVLILIEYAPRNEEECHRVLHKNEMGLSGAQASIAIGWYLKFKVKGLPDKEMAKVSVLPDSKV